MQSILRKSNTIKANLKDNPNLDRPNTLILNNNYSNKSDFLENLNLNEQEEEENINNKDSLWIKQSDQLSLSSIFSLTSSSCSTCSSYTTTNSYDLESPIYCSAYLSNNRYENCNLSTFKLKKEIPYLNKKHENKPRVTPCNSNKNNNQISSNNNNNNANSIKNVRFSVETNNKENKRKKIKEFEENFEINFEKKLEEIESLDYDIANQKNSEIEIEFESDTNSLAKQKETICKNNTKMNKLKKSKNKSIPIATTIPTTQPAIKSTTILKNSSSRIENTINSKANLDETDINGRSSSLIVNKKPNKKVDFIDFNLNNLKSSFFNTSSSNSEETNPNKKNTFNIIISRTNSNDLKQIKCLSPINTPIEINTISSANANNQNTKLMNQLNSFNSSSSSSSSSNSNQLSLPSSSQSSPKSESLINYIVNSSEDHKLLTHNSNTSNEDSFADSNLSSTSSELVCSATTKPNKQTTNGKTVATSSLSSTSSGISSNISSASSTTSETPSANDPNMITVGINNSNNNNNNGSNKNNEMIYDNKICIKPNKISSKNNTTKLQTNANTNGVKAANKLAPKAIISDDGDIEVETTLTQPTTEYNIYRNEANKNEYKLMRSEHFNSDPNHRYSMRIPASSKRDSIGCRGSQERSSQRIVSSSSSASSSATHQSSCVKSNFYYANAINNHNQVQQEQKSNICYQSYTQQQQLAAAAAAAAAVSLFCFYYKFI